MFNNKLFFHKLLLPIESGSDYRCIWCLRTSDFNHAHIFPKKIVSNVRSGENQLLSSVCEYCNSTWSRKIEDWIFKYTPLAQWSEILVKNREFKAKYNIIYVFVEQFFNWAIVLYEQNSQFMPMQLAYNDKSDLMVFGNQPDFSPYDFLKQIDVLVRAETYHIHIYESFPEDFKPRAFFINKTLVITGRTAEQVATFLNGVKNSVEIMDLYDHGSLVPLADIRTPVPEILFQWSLKRYFFLCMKIAIEALCKIKGKEYILHSRFDLARKLFIESDKFESRDIRFVPQKGFLVNRLVPKGFYSLPEGRELDFSKVICRHFHFPNTHGVIFYKSVGFLVSAVQLFNIEPLFFVICEGENIPDEFLYVNFDFEEKSFSFLRLLEGEERLEAIEDIISEGHLDKLKD